MNVLVELPVTIEEIFQTGVFKVLKVLIEERETSISVISKKTKLRWNYMQKHLALLIRAGLVKEKVFGRNKNYEVNGDDERIKTLDYLFKLWHNGGSI